MADFDMISEFGALDELIQVIYQGAHKFIVLSNVTDDAWSVYLTLANSEGRWWSGRWTEEDVLDFVVRVLPEKSLPLLDEVVQGQKTSTMLIEQFAENLASSVLKGELHVGNWSSEKGASINLTLGSTSKKPVQISLNEMEPVEAAKYATTMFATIASYAQERKCKLYPSAYEVSGSSSNATVLPDSKTTQIEAVAPEKSVTPQHTKVHKPKSVSVETSAREKTAEDEIKKLKAELAREKRKAPEETTRQDNPLLQSKAKNNAPAARQVKGASLANPNKKARKYQALEFEDD